MTLQRSHMGFTLARTFTASPSATLGPEPVSDASPAQVVGAQLHLHPIARQYPDVVHPHLARDVRQHVVPVLELYPELRVGQRLGDGAFNLYDVFFGQGPPLPQSLQDAPKLLKPNKYLITPAPRITPQEHVSYPPCSPFWVSTNGPLSVTATVCSRSEEHTSELQSRQYLVCRLLLEIKTRQ